MDKCPTLVYVSLLWNGLIYTEFLYQLSSKWVWPVDNKQCSRVEAFQFSDHQDPGEDHFHNLISSDFSKDKFQVGKGKGKRGFV